MNSLLTLPNLIAICTLIGIIFIVYDRFSKPQIETDKDSIKITDRIIALEKTVTEIREKHLISVESDLKTLNVTLQDLSKTVVRLSTIIDERIPKATGK